MKVRWIATTALLTTTALLPTTRGWAATATGLVKLRVMSAISLANVSDLNFGSAMAGDGTKVVPAGAADNDDNGSFLVRGEPNAAFTISLPGETKLANGTAPPILVNNFTSNLGAAGNLGANGQATLLIGATRAPLPQTQPAGVYSGSYTVTVVY